MKSARLLVALLNLVLIGFMAYAGVRIYTHFFDSDTNRPFFEELPIPKVDKDPTPPDRHSGPSIEEYKSAIEILAKKPVVEVEAPVVEIEPAVPELNVDVVSVVYDRDNPEKSGAHIKANNIPRFIAVGDKQNISDKLPYQLVELIEEKPNVEYTLMFEDEKGNRKQRKYTKKSN